MNLKILALDLADTTGWSWRIDDRFISMGSFSAPDKLDPLYKRMWIVDRVMSMIRTIKSDPATPQDSPLWVVYEGTFLAEYNRANGRSRKGKAVDTKEYLDRLGGAVERQCYSEDVLPVLVPLHAISSYMGLSIGVKRFQRKQRAISMARLLVADSLPEHAAAFLQALEYIESWGGGNRDGEPKSSDTVLTHANKFLADLKPFECTIDVCDSVVISEVARSMILQEAQKMRYE